MTGDITAYTSGTGALVVNVLAVRGTLTAAAWTISLSGAVLDPTLTTRVARSTNTALALNDLGRLFDLSSTFTQTLAAVATLKDGWYCYLRNTGNGNITLDPAASELVSGAATYVLKPGYSILLTYNTTAFDVLELKTQTYS